jgi:tRNA(His) 5'-end guanylyltransferase
MDINYNNELEIYKKGSVLIGAEDGENWVTQSTEEEKHLRKRNIKILHCDIIKDNFWVENDSLLKSKTLLNRELKQAKKLKVDK